MADKIFSTNLSQFDNSWYRPGANFFKQVLWYFVNTFVFKTSLFPISSLKTFLLKAFGARIGKGVNIKPSVNIKYPWRLSVGNNSWIGENVWIDNLDDVAIGSNVCISQGAMLLCGNHNFKNETFDLFTGKIIIEDGVWLGAKSIVCPGITCKSHSILSVGSVATSDLDEFGIYQGNPAIKIKDRF
jgi:putative colanic acid biosynthesis acetyltransferase WcaF